MTVYELTKHSIPVFFPEMLFIIVGLLMLILSIFALKKFLRERPTPKRKNTKKKNWRKGVIPILMVGFVSVLFVVISIVSSLNRWQDEDLLMQQVADNNISVVSGQVENFETPLGGHTPETYVVGGVPFSYYDGNEESYCTTKENGGFIQGNGQQVRITYIEGEGMNFIVKLELAQKPSAES